MEIAPEWSVVKTGRGGTRYGKTMRNPVRQVKRQAWLLCDYLKKEKARAWVQPLVLFSHPQASLTGTENCSKPIVSRNELVAWIKAFRPDHGRPISHKTRQCLVSLKQANTSYQSLVTGTT